MKPLSQHRYTGWLILAAIVAIFMLPQLCGKGMFFDGLTYSTIARNLAEGHGTFWNPSYTETLYPVFHEHPPLVFGIQSLFFRVLGDHYYTEKIYSFFTFLLSAWLIIAIWRQFELRFQWLPLLLWMSCQVVTWGYVSNMQENTMGIFCLLAAWAFLQSFNRERYVLVWQLLSGISIAAALLCKGPVGAFPLAVAGLYWLTTRRISFAKAVLYTIVPVTALAVFFIALWQLPEARNNIIDYLNTQLLPALAGKRDHSEGNRLFIVSRLVVQLLPTIIIVGLLYLISRKKVRVDAVRQKNVLFFLALGLSASLPVMVSLKQMTAYIMPALPFFALAAGLFIVPYLSVLWEKVTPKIFVSVNVILVLLVVGFSVYSVTRINRMVRDFETQGTLDGMEDILPRNETISIPDELYNDWRLQAYLIRFYHISLDSRDKSRMYFLTTKQLQNSVPAGYTEMPSHKDEALILFKRK